MSEDQSQSRPKVVQVKSSGDLDKIKELTSGILGELCWEARLGHGDELKLEIGAKFSDWVGDHGEWMLGSRGTAWKLLSPDGTLVAEDYDRDDNTPSEVSQKIQVMVDRRITAFEVLYPSLGLKVTFDNSNILTIIPTAKDDDWELPYWELYTPNGVLMVGPKMQWAYEH